MKKVIIDKYLDYNFHDSTLELLNIFPSNKIDNDKAEISIKILDPDSKEINVVFHECANIAFNADFDVLRDNSGFGNTSHTEAIDDFQYIKNIIQKSKEFINIEYENLKSPIDKKIEKISEYICFKVFFFGGTLEIVAKNFTINEDGKSEQMR